MATFNPFSYLNELPKEDWDHLERMIDQVGMLAIVSALANIAGYKAEHIRENWQDEASAKRWDKASNVLAKVGYTRGMTA
jgi:hypothetical protein